MELPKMLSSSMKIATAGIGLIVTFYTVIDFTLFVSDPDYIEKNNKHVRSNDANAWTWSLFMNMCYVTLFVTSHSLLALKEVKRVFRDSGLGDVQRSIYIIVTCASLQLLLKNWHHTVDYPMWRFTKGPLFWACIITHVLSWSIIYAATICMDVNELLGLKQVYYSINNLPDPLKCKSEQLQRLYSHMRHPSFLGYFIVLWFCPYMTLDRALLSAILTCYMYLAWNTDDNDARYQQFQFEKKFD